MIRLKQRLNRDRKDSSGPKRRTENHAPKAKQNDGQKENTEISLHD